MSVLKHIFVDLLVTAFILTALLTGIEWMGWIIIGYTGLLLLLKIYDYFGTGFTSFRSGQTDEVPQLPFHLLYAANVILLLTFSWLITGIMWLLIWLFSWLKTRQD
jgi:hypothetical protein